MATDNNREQRRRVRTEVEETVEINSGLPYRGGTLRDISSCGAAVTYCGNQKPVGAPLTKGEEIDLIVGGVTKLPAHVARIFDGGYAVEFNWGVDLTAAFK